MPGLLSLLGGNAAASSRDAIRGAELDDPAVGDPLGDVDVAGAVPGGAVGGDEDAGLALLGRDSVLAALLRVGVVAEDGNDLVVLVEDAHAPVEAGEEQLAAALVE